MAKLAPNGKEYTKKKTGNMFTDKKEMSKYTGQFTLYSYAGMDVLYQITGVYTNFTLYLDGDDNRVYYEPREIKDEDITGFKLRPIKVIPRNKSNELYFDSLHVSNIKKGIYDASDSVKCQKVINKLNGIRAEKMWNKKEDNKKEEEDIDI